MKRNTIAKTFTIAAVTVLALGVAATAKADNKGCTNATLNGTFAYTSTGTITSPPEIAGPIAEVGTQSFDGKGGTTATAMISSSGSVDQLTITGTYIVNPDCTGTLKLQVLPYMITVDVYFVIADNLNELQMVETDLGFVITRIARRQFPVGDWRNQ
jgi:hypothetical protein